MMLLRGPNGYTMFADAPLSRTELVDLDALIQFLQSLPQPVQRAGRDHLGPEHRDDVRVAELGGQPGLALGPVQIQPSEIAKLSLVIWAAHIYAHKERRLKELHHILVPVVPGLLAVIALVLVSAGLHVAWNVRLKTAGDPLKAATVGLLAASIGIVPAGIAAADRAGEVVARLRHLRPRREAPVAVDQRVGVDRVEVLQVAIAKAAQADARAFQGRQVVARRVLRHVGFPMHSYATGGTGQLC